MELGLQPQRLRRDPVGRARRLRGADTTCKRRASREQQARMQKYRKWFAQARTTGLVSASDDDTRCCESVGCGWMGERRPLRPNGSERGISI